MFFYRPTISDPEPEQKPHEPSNPGFRRRNSSAAADLAAASAVSPKTERVPIYGSVSSADIIESVKAALAETEEGARVVLGPEDVTIIRSDGEASDIDADRFKTLGNFEVDIRVKGGDAVRRTVSINPQEV